MGFRVDTYCKIWKIEDKGNYSVASISVSRKNKETGAYDTDFQHNFVRLVGNAHNDCKGVDIPKNGLSAKITSCDVTTKYDADNDKNYTNYIIFGLELSENSSNSSKPSKKTSSKKTTKKAEETSEDTNEDEEDDLPF